MFMELYSEMYEIDKERYAREMKKFETEAGGKPNQTSIEKTG